MSQSVCDYCKNDIILGETGFVHDNQDHVCTDCCSVENINKVSKKYYFPITSYEQEIKMKPQLPVGFYIMNDNNMTYLYRLIGKTTNGQVVCETMFRKIPVNKYPVLTNIDMDVIKELLKQPKMVLTEFDGEWIDIPTPKEAAHILENL